MSKGSHKEALEEAIEAEIDATLLLYFNLPLSFIVDLPTPWSEAAGLIKIGKRDDWIMDYQSLKLENFTVRQRDLIAAIHNWIVNYSDSFRLMDLNDDEKIIADYIKNTFPWRQWLWLLPNKIVKNISAHVRYWVHDCNC